jgi:hypothetical protein
MKKTVLFISLLAFGFWGAAAWAQKPKLNTMTFRVDGQTKTCTSGEVTVSATLVFNTTMRDSTPKIQYGLAAPYSLPVPFKNKSWTNGNTTFVASFDINSEVPSTADGLYKFLIRKAYAANGDTMAPALSDTIKNSSDQPATLYISRKGKLTTSINKLDFGTIKMGRSKDLSLTIRNVTCDSLTLSGFPGSNSAFAVINPPIGEAMAPDANLTLTLRFLPTIRRTYADSVNIIFTSYQQQDSVTVKLAGIARGPEMIFTPNPSLNFGTLDIGSTASQTVRFTNRKARPDTTLSDTLKISSLTLNLTTAYTLSENPLIVAPGDTKSVTITFTPTEGRTYTSSLNFATNDFNLNRPTGNVSFTVTGAGSKRRLHRCFQRLPTPGRTARRLYQFQHDDDLFAP